MILYILHDTDPLGGYFAAQEFKPDPETERYVVDEVRAVLEFPEELWETALSGGLPIDVDRSNDSTWLQWWDEAEPVWSRDSLSSTGQQGDT